LKWILVVVGGSGGGGAVALEALIG